MIEIQVNGEDISLESEMNIRRLLETVPVPPNYLAVEINEEVVPREQYDDQMVRAGDVIELVTLVGGG